MARRLHTIAVFLGICALACLILLIVAINAADPAEPSRPGHDSHYPDPVVQTNYGPVQGLTRNVEATPSKPDGHNGRLVDLFLGVPFAQAPMDELRFEKPALMHKWRETKRTQTPPPKCIPHVRPATGWAQHGEFSEDCLYLNIIAPHRGEVRSRLLIKSARVHTSMDKETFSDPYTFIQLHSTIPPSAVHNPRWWIRTRFVPSLHRLRRFGAEIRVGGDHHRLH